MTRLNLFSIFFILTSISCSGQKPTDNLRIAYIANMGVLAESGDETVIFDGFHKEYKPDYAYPSLETVEELFTGNYKDFSKIEIALFTHNHGDHFDAEYGREFLEKNPNSILAGSPQIRESIGKSIKGNLEIAYDGSLQTIDNQGIEFRGFRLDHAGGRHKNIQNIGYIVDLNGFKILHIGDTDWDVGSEIFRKHKISEKGIDVAVMPYWLLMEESSKAKFDELINAKKIIATHIPPHVTSDQLAELSSMQPQVVLFTLQGQIIEIEK